MNERNRNQSGYYNCCDIIYNNTRIVHNNKLNTYYYLVLLPLNLFLRFWQRGLAKRLGKEAWQRGLAKRLGKKAWQKGLAKRLGKKAQIKGVQWGHSPPARQRGFTSFLIMLLISRYVTHFSISI